MRISILKKIIALFVGFITLGVNFFAGGYQPKEAGPILTFAAISDVHLTVDPLRADMLALGLADMESASHRLNALLFCGDNTDHGYRDQYNLLAQTLAKYSPADEIILAEGNHDTWTSSKDNDYAPAKALFLEYSKRISGRELTEAYFTTEINGYTFIVMASEYDHTDAYFSDAQLSWLDTALSAAATDGKPVFVVSHWPLNGSHGLTKVWTLEETDPATGGMGDQSDAVEAILKKYKNVFLISGHLHNGFSTETTKKLDPIFKYTDIEHDGSFHSVNLPSYMYPGTRGSGLNAQGYVFEVYADKVILRGRNFAAGAWLPTHSETIPLVK